MTLEDVKNYLRIDEDITEDDITIQSLITAAQQYITNQTGKQYADDEIWNVCIELLVSHWYDTRQPNPTKPGTLSEYPHSITAIITHIALCGAYPEEVKI
ncbi:head-tail connector protein [Anaerosinus massiliensis]|uniref:head-tail connector protein n=1 Tax=Massilibacillus massiliensis TaxID=1806837 RepID=UPI000AEA599F|nr:head-tail connector protein [Massilibacillus massiliensis]